LRNWRRAQTADHCVVLAFVPLSVFRGFTGTAFHKFVGGENAPNSGK